MNRWPMTLQPKHIEMLQASGITPEHAAARGYLTADTKAMVVRYGFADHQARTGLLVPLLGIDGQRWGWQLRADAPRTRKGKPVKYDTPAGQRNGIDVPPGVGPKLADPAVPLWITEGSKKADAGALAGLCIVALTGVWNWRGKNDRGGKVTLPDWHDIALNGRDVIIGFDGDAARKPGVQKAMVALADWLRTKDARPRFLHLPDTDDKIGLDDYLTAGHTVADLENLVSDEPPALVAPAAPRPPAAAPDSPERLDDAHLAEWMARRALGEHWCWAGGLGWLRWTGKRWKPTNESAVTEAVRRAVVDLHHREASAGASIDRLRKLDGLLSATRIRAITSLVRGVAAIDADRFDQQADVLNVDNGIIDLTTGSLGPHDPRLLLTKITRVSYTPGATHPDWTQALKALPEPVAGWMQVRFGQAATGHPAPDDVLPILQGGGSNGKSTILSATRYALGEHAVQVPERVLTANPSDHPTELMTLFGARLATIEETPEAQHLNVQRLKSTVGTPTMNARRIRQDNVEWRTTHTLMLATNYRPRIDESDHGTWRRLALVRFPYTFASSGLRERIEQNLDGQLEAVLAWIVEGARQWYAVGRAMPEAPAIVAADTRAWRAEADRVLAYTTERLVFDPAACVTTSDLFEDFTDWLTDHGHRAWSEQTFVDRFGQHSEVVSREVVKARPKAAKGLRMRNPMEPQPGRPTVWLGVRWRTDSDDDADDKTAGQRAGTGRDRGTQGTSREEKYMGLTDNPCPTLSPDNSRPVSPACAVPECEQLVSAWRSSRGHRTCSSHDTRTSDFYDAKEAAS